MKACTLLALCLFMLALPAMAALANFQGNCVSGIPTLCTFDARRTPMGQFPTFCPGSWITGYFWDFGDGTSVFTASPQVLYTYTTAIHTYVHLAVFCGDGTDAAKLHCFDNVNNINGCIQTGVGWTPP